MRPRKFLDKLKKKKNDPHLEKRKAILYVDISKFDELMFWSARMFQELNCSQNRKLDLPLQILVSERKLRWNLEVEPWIEICWTNGEILCVRVWYWGASISVYICMRRFGPCLRDQKRCLPPDLELDVTCAVHSHQSVGFGAVSSWGFVCRWFETFSYRKFYKFIFILYIKSLLGHPCRQP